MNQIFNKVFFSLLVHASGTLACEMLKVDKNEIYINPEASYLHFGDQIRTAGPIATEIFKCQKEAGKFLMFSIGVKRPGLFSDVDHISYDGSYNQKKCRFQNSNLIADKFEERTFQQIQKQHHFVRSCLYLRILDVNRTPIEFNPNQTACRMRSQTSGTVSMDGPYCFAKINRNQHLQFSVEVKPDCLNPEFLSDQKISAQDLDVVVNTWVAGDDSGVSSDLEYLRSIPIKVSLLPSSKLLSKSENLNNSKIEFAATFQADIHQGPVALQKVGRDRYNVDFSLEFDNRSKESCRPGLPCAGPSNFQLPVAGLLEFFEGDELIKSWPFLAIAPAQYQGVLKNRSSMTLENFKFQSSKTYKFSFRMIDPSDDYWISFNRILAIKFNLPTPNETLDGFQNTPTTQVLGDTKALAALPSSLAGQAVNAAIDELNRQVRGGSGRQMWPPKFEKICTVATGQCKSIDEVPEVVHLELQFQFKNVNADTQLAQFKNLKKTKALFSKAVQVKYPSQLPAYHCEP